jgi:hypothetical protein
MHSEAVKRMLMAVKQQHRAASHDRPKHQVRGGIDLPNTSELTSFQVVQGSAAMDRTLNEASAALPNDSAHEDLNAQKWTGFNSN